MSGYFSWVRRSTNLATVAVRTWGTATPGVTTKVMESVSSNSSTDIAPSSMAAAEPEGEAEASLLATRCELLSPFWSLCFFSSEVDLSPLVLSFASFSFVSLLSFASFASFASFPSFASFERPSMELSSFDFILFRSRCSFFTSESFFIAGLCRNLRLCFSSFCDPHSSFPSFASFAFFRSSSLFFFTWSPSVLEACRSRAKEMNSSRSGEIAEQNSFATLKR
mmetsp:Transcript_11980/g.48282  ORF Transcript_11980/g.48282 Transcript_11980/m.48282 type:complete len:223 (+) Transcript_11980:2551-3219(+)